MKNPYFTLTRKFLESDMWLSEKFTKGQAWVDLIGLANWQDKTVKMGGVSFDVKRGEVARSKVFLAKRWGWSRGKVIRFLDGMEMEQQIVQQTVHLKKDVTSLISLVNYDQYQLDGTPNDTANGTPDGTPKGKRKKEKEIYSPNFLAFWEKYPRKEKKKTAFIAYKKIQNPKPSLQTVLDSIEDHKKTKQWEDSQYIPLPATFLNARQWEDEITKPLNGKITPTMTPKEQIEDFLS